MMPIVEQTLVNYKHMGAAASSSGPLVRGDTDTIGQHLSALVRNPALKRVYSALAQAALVYLPTRNRKAIARLLS